MCRIGSRPCRFRQSGPVRRASRRPARYLPVCRVSAVDALAHAVRAPRCRRSARGGPGAASTLGTRSMISSSREMPLGVTLGDGTRRAHSTCVLAGRRQYRLGLLTLRLSVVEARATPACISYVGRPDRGDWPHRSSTVYVCGVWASSPMCRSTLLTGSLVSGLYGAHWASAGARYQRTSSRPEY